MKCTCINNALSGCYLSCACKEKQEDELDKINRSAKYEAISKALYAVSIVFFFLGIGLFGVAFLIMALQ